MLYKAILTVYLTRKNKQNSYIETYNIGYYTSLSKLEQDIQDYFTKIKKIPKLIKMMTLSCHTLKLNDLDKFLLKKKGKSSKVVDSTKFYVYIDQKFINANKIYDTNVKSKKYNQFDLLKMFEIRK